MRYSNTMARYLRFQNEPEWLAWRENIPFAVGGSRIVDIMGRGFKTRIKASQASAGHAAEDLIVARACADLGCSVERGWCVEDEQEPWIRASLDALVPDQEVWEIKSVWKGWAPSWRDGCDEKVRIQVLWEMTITGLPGRVIAVFPDEYGAGPQTHLERVIGRGRMEMWEFSLDATRADRMALVDAARVWREVSLSGGTPEPLNITLSPADPKPRVREATPDEAMLIARYAATQRVAQESAALLEDLKEQLRTCARGSAGIKGGGRTALVNRRGTVTIKE